MFSVPDFIQPDYVAEMTYRDRYAEDQEAMEYDDPPESHWEEPWAVYDPD